MKKLFLQYSGLKRELYILFIGKLVTAMGSFVWPMLTFFLTTKLGFGDGLSTFLIASASVVMLPASLLGGKLADHFSRKYVIVIFDLMTVTFYILAAILPIGYHTAIFIFFAGMFQTLESPAYDALCADFSTSDQREKAISITYLGYNLGFVFGASLSGVLFQNHISLAFLANALAILTSTLLILFFVNMKNAVGADEESDETYGEYEIPCDEKRSVFSVLKERRVVLFMMLVGCIASMPQNLVGILLPLQLKEDMGQVGAKIYGYMNSLNGFTVILFTPLLTMVLKKFTEIPKTIAGQLLFLSGMVLFANYRFVWVLYVGMFIYTLGEVVTVIGANPYSSKRIPASHRGRVGGLSNVIYSLFSSVTQYIISFILTLSGSNYLLLWIIFMSLGAVAVCIYGLLYRPDKKAFPALYKSDHEKIFF